MSEWFHARDEHQNLILINPDLVGSVERTEKSLVINSVRDAPIVIPKGPEAERVFALFLSRLARAGRIQLDSELEAERAHDGSL